jgi:hypothetical protein
VVAAIESCRRRHFGGLCSSRSPHRAAHARPTASAVAANSKLQDEIHRLTNENIELQNTLRTTEAISPLLGPTIALAEGALVSWPALIGLGLDSVIEVPSKAAVAWQFAGRDTEARE